MHFQLLKIVLWPKSDHKPREVTFHPGLVNVISGHSKTGKSAVIPIIDYCLASRHCAIPVGVIRDSCAWFGVVVDTVEGQKLLARREPGTQKSTGDMYVLEGESFDIPHAITEKNSTDDQVRALLDRLSGLTQLDLDPNPEIPFKQRPSFRDLTAFMFQPQNIVANPNVLFYKADTTEHREKLRGVLPYVLKAITPRTLALRHEVDLLNRRLRRLQSELSERTRISAARLAEGRTWLTQARELGITSDPSIPDNWADVHRRLNEISESSTTPRTTTYADIDSTLTELSRLRRQESDLVSRASTHRQRMMELRRLREGANHFATALNLQRERLSLATWMRAELERRNDAALLIPAQTAQGLDQLCGALASLEAQQQAHPLATTTLDAEMLRQRTQTEEALEQLAAVRQEIRAYEAESSKAAEESRRMASADRFLGGLQQLLSQIKQSEDADVLTGEIDDLTQKIEGLQAQIQEGSVQKRLESTLNEVQHITSGIVPTLNAEWGNSPVRLNPKELTVQVSRDGRNDYLWEIGSGANWLAYHVAITLALQTYFLKHPPSPVPSLLIYDQPSQVYFPRLTLDEANGKKDFKLTDQEDIQAVRRIFQAMGSQVEAAKGRLQVIVLDHAGADVWGNLPSVTLVENWRDKKLVPNEWLTLGGES